MPPSIEVRNLVGDQAGSPAASLVHVASKLRNEPVADHINHGTVLHGAGQQTERHTAGRPQFLLGREADQFIGGRAHRGVGRRRQLFGARAIIRQHRGRDTHSQ